MESKALVLILKKTGWYVLSLLTFAAALYGSFRPALMAVSASYRLPSFKDVTTLKYVDVQRKVQKHYLDYGIYIPLDDIILNQDENSAITQLSLLEQVCGEGTLYIWVPIRIRIPVLGEKVLEWCLLRK